MDINRYRVLGFEKGYSRERRNKAYLVILQTGSRASRTFLEESTREMKELARAAAIRVLGICQTRLVHPSPKHFIRGGKLEEIRDEARRLGANVLIFNTELTPTQTHNIESFSEVPAVDRTGLILEIFGRRAKSREGKLQVELAQLNYTLPRLGGLGMVMSRVGGGMKSRGPGEQELETDRRKVRHRIHQIKSQLKKVREHRQRIRDSHKRQRFFTVALVGYTNAGKTMLLNALTGAGARTEDKVFATLDPVTRMESYEGHRDILFIDTVGFLKDLPHTLIESFHATLEEAVEADLLIHVLDVTAPEALRQKIAAEKVLAEIHAEKKPVVLAMNKGDLMSTHEQEAVQRLWPEGIIISAKERQGLNALLLKVGVHLKKFKKAADYPASENVSDA